MNPGRHVNNLAFVGTWGICLYLTFTMGVYDSDILAEKTVAVQVVEGGNPHLPLGDIEGDGTFAAPRTPGALLLVAPLAWIEDELLVTGVTVLNVTAIVAILLLSLRLTGKSERWVLVAPLIVLSVPGLYMARGTNLAPLVGLGVVACWYLVRRDDVSWAGVPLGLAATMRLFPIWIAVALLVGGRRRAGLTAIGVLTGMSAAGLLLPAVTVAGTLDTLGQTGFYAWDSNLSLSALLDPPLPALVTSLAILGGLVGWLILYRPRWTLGILAGPIALLAGPVTWPMYLAAVGPFIPAVFIPVMALWFLPLFGVPQEWPLAISIMLMIGAWLFGIRAKSRPIPPFETEIVIDLTDRGLEALPVENAAEQDPLRTDAKILRPP